MPSNIHAPLSVLSEDESAFRDAVASFVDGEVRPRVSAMERAGKLDPDLIPKYFELGMMGIQVPEQYGGGGGSLMMVTLAVEEISKVDAAAAIVVDVQNTLVLYPMLAYGTDEQRERYLPRLCTDTVGAYALSEAGSGSDAFGLATRAEKKRRPLDPHGAQALDHERRGSRRVHRLRERGSGQGLQGDHGVHRREDLPGVQRGKKEDKMGIRASSTTELILDGVEVPECNVLGPVGDGYKIAMETLNEGRIGIGAQMIGNAAGALAAAVAYVKERKQFGKTLAEFQGVQFQLAQVATELEAARLMVYNATRLKEGGHEIAKEAAMAKLYASQVCERVTSLAVELFGGYGYTKDFPVEKFYRDAKIGKIYEGTSNMQLATIAKAMLK